jgi:methionyl-tRNA synthetase
VFFATGSDEHGEKIQTMAKAAGKQPKVFVDEMAVLFQKAWKNLNISEDRFIRTTETGHKQAVQKALDFMYAKKDIYLGKYEGLYCKGCEQYKTEKDLIDGLCPDHKVAPERVSEETYMFRMSKYQSQLLELIQNDVLEVWPQERKNEILSFYQNEGLKDVSFSRAHLDWGVPIPWDIKHVTYVWADAFLNYLTVLDWQGPGSKVLETFPPDLQLMSKDIMRVHATIWPAMLLSLELAVPKKLFVHGFFTIDGQKMSKSIGNIIDPNDLVRDFGTDAARYLLLNQFPFGQDGDIDQSRFAEKYNADLANDLGNLANRVLVMLQKYELTTHVRPTKPDFLLIEEHMLKIEIFEALQAIWQKIRAANKFIEDNKPWELAKTDKNKLLEVLQKLYTDLEIISYNLSPFMPETSKKLSEALTDFAPINLFPKS